MSNIQTKTLYPFQQKALDDVLGFLFKDKKLKSGLCVLPTGAGKSVLLAHLSKHLKGQKCLMIVPSMELLLQNNQAILNEGGVCSLYSASVGCKDVSDLTLATIGSLKGKGEEFKGFKYIIIDEAHFKFTVGSDSSVFLPFLRAVKPRKLLGLTATPFVPDSVKGQPALKILTYLRPKLFQDIIHVTQVYEVIKEDRWANIEYEIHPVDKSRLVINGGEYSGESIDLFLKENDVNNRICLKMALLCEHKCLTFVPTIKIATTMSEWFNKKFKGSFESAVVSAKTPKKERLDIIKRFKDMNDNLNHIINFGTLTTGFDFPELSHIIGGRPTMSLALYYQMIGRGCRRNEDNTTLHYYDMSGNYEFFGDVQKLTIEKLNDVWRCFIGDKLFTGFPLNCGLTITKQTILHPPKLITNYDRKLKIGFGKFKGKEVYKLPAYYRDYLLKSFEEDPLSNEDEEKKALKEAFLTLRQNDVILSLRSN